MNKGFWKGEKGAKKEIGHHKGSENAFYFLAHYKLCVRWKQIT